MSQAPQIALVIPARYAQLPPPSPLEHTEQLEQLRLLSAGVSIRAFAVAPTGPGVDTPA